jgi:hypothetical protein
MKRMHWIGWAVVTALVLAGCPGNEANNGSDGGADVGAADTGKDTGGGPADVGADTADPSDAAADADQPDPRCQDVPACEQGYAFDAFCLCRAPLSRNCTSDADCRANETCQAVPRMEGSDQTFDICIFDESTLAVEQGGASGELLAAAVSKVVTPDGFETAKPAGLDGSQMNFGEFDPNKWNDCGYDGLCPGDPGYTEPDDGEGDGVMQGAFIAGFSAGRPAQYCPEELIGCDRSECCASKLAHDDLKVQISVMRVGDVTVGFAALDAVGWFHTDIERIRRRISKDVDLDLFIMGASHSHEGPDTVGQWGPGAGIPLATGRDPKFIQKIYDQTVAGVEEAIANLEPATAFAGVIDEGVEGLAFNDSRTPFIIDDNIPVVRLVRKSDGSPIATMLSVANHAEAVWSSNPYLTADYFHYVRKYVREGLGAAGDAPALDGLGGVTVLFAGAVGGLLYPRSFPARAYDGTEVRDMGFAKADALGQRIAQIVLEGEANGALTEVTGDGLEFATKRYLTPIQNPTFLLAAITIKVFRRDLYNAIIAGVRTLPGPPEVMSQVGIVRLGDVTFFTAPGELFPELLVGGFPGKGSTQDPTIGDVLGEKWAPTCDEQGLPTPNDDGTSPCVIRKDAVNPPDWSAAPDGPYMYERVPGRVPFFIGLGMDFLGYMVPPYDFEFDGSEAPGDHYEETNSASKELVPDWLEAMGEVLGAVAD